MHERWPSLCRIDRIPRIPRILRAWRKRLIETLQVRPAKSTARCRRPVLGSASGEADARLFPRVVGRSRNVNMDSFVKLAANNMSRSPKYPAGIDVISADWSPTVGCSPAGLGWRTGPSGISVISDVDTGGDPRARLMMTQDQSKIAVCTGPSICSLNLEIATGRHPNDRTSSQALNAWCRLVE
jgi:hypothetical protein